MFPRRTLVLLGALGALAFVAAAACADELTVDWHTIDGGGVMHSTGGVFELSGTIGQPDAGAPLTGGDFELIGGFWAVEVEGPPLIGDIDHDGDVDFDDLNLLLAAYGTSTGEPGFNPDADLDLDGDVDFDDLNVLLAHYGL